MKKILLYIVSVSMTLSVSIAQARVINVAEHGIVPGKDITFTLNRLIDEIKEEEDVTLFFPKGQYDFYPENAVEKYRDVANHDNGLKRMGFPLYNSKGLTIDGNDSLFMFHGRVVPFTLESTENVTLKNFKIDFIRSFHAELTIVERDVKKKTFVATIDSKKYPYLIKNNQIFFDRFDQLDPIGSNIVFDPKTKSPVFNTRKYNINGLNTKVTQLSDNRLKFENLGKSTPPPIDNVLVAYGIHPTSRLVPGIHITNSKNVKLQDITVFDAGGMALIVERTENIHLNRFNVTSGDDRMVATRADATHFVGCKGTILMENSLLEHMLDDGINVHGAYVNVDSYLGDKQFIASISHFQQMGLVFGEAGDKVAILSRETVLPFFETSITQVKKINEKRFIITLADVPAEMPKGPLSMENLTWNPDLVMRNNTIRENRARSVLVTTKGKVLIENNYFNSQMHGILIEGDNKKWYESGAVQDVTIRNNTFVNSGFGGGAAYPLYASPMLTPQQRVGEGFYHKNINFTGNTLESFNGLIAFSRSVDGLNISNNTINKSTGYPNNLDYPAIDLHYSNDVNIEKNKANGFDEALKINKSADTSKVSVEKNKGFMF
ncbi:right-handed parallel beta-helix repeat-containing protein [Pseudocolwellia agarivorans]|uniref:right-handed parallel beta-helix repeat-containing protein n=1 Tax=Pseudocolwellia agarivorans TaxID=1911682 RepID=UPI000986BD95|nr:right-handed parallel beta-helix repeat-containing protein [Pseudocolwellia agarivorans]